jgi:hypothetical protein
MHRLIRVSIALLLFTVVVGAGGCRSSVKPAQSGPKFTADDLRKLRWIEGAWRGSGAEQPAFFERYRFESDTVLVVEGFADEKLAKVNDTTRFELKDGEFGGGSEGSRYVATAIDDNSITFEPKVKARNAFTWKRESKDSWTAILKWPRAADKPAGERVYHMERWPKY